MLATHAVGIDLGTTYSCIAYLNEHGEPVTIPNAEGEFSTPSAVLFENGEAIVGMEALRNAIVQPKRVVMNSKRFMGDANHRWTVDGKQYTPVDIAALILKKLIQDAEHQVGDIKQAVITVPAQFGDLQRQMTAEAGRRAGLERIDIINEPVAAALCYVLGSEGLWFTELAGEQRILVYDLGGGTFDLSLVKYQRNEVRVIASSGDLHLGGIDWNQALVNVIAEKFQQEFGTDPRHDPESLQYLTWEVEQTKRSLSVRPKAPLTCQHDGRRKTYQIEQEKFAKLTSPLVKRTGEITKRLLRDHGVGWAHVDVVLTTGGASRMPMIREMLKELSGRTLNTSLSPDQSIAHGATYYAGMLISSNEFVHSILSPEANARLSQISQQSVTARGLGILVRDEKRNARTPHYLIPANTPLPVSITQTFGTVIPNQKRVHLHVVESGARPELPWVPLGACVIDDLPPNLPKDSQVAVTISYDAQARVHVSAVDVTSGKRAATEIVRTKNLVAAEVPEDENDSAFALVVPPDLLNPPAPTETPTATGKPVAQPPRPASVKKKLVPPPRPPAPPASGKPPAAKPPASSVAPPKSKISVKPAPTPRQLREPATPPPPAVPSESEIAELPRKKPTRRGST